MITTHTFLEQFEDGIVRKVHVKFYSLRKIFKPVKTPYCKMYVNIEYYLNGKLHKVQFGFEEPITSNLAEAFFNEVSTKFIDLTNLIVMDDDQIKLTTSKFSFIKEAVQSVLDTNHKAIALQFVSNCIILMLDNMSMKEYFDLWKEELRNIDKKNFPNNLSFYKELMMHEFAEKEDYSLYYDEAEKI
jgi:hypothetical protein